eukprot:2603311-Alexandrium_andersonii.AAC.1
MPCVSSNTCRSILHGPCCIRASSSGLASRRPQCLHRSLATTSKGVQLKAHCESQGSDAHGRYAGHELGQAVSDPIACVWRTPVGVAVAGDAGARADPRGTRKLHST